jgi:hypothetical protein
METVMNEVVPAIIGTLMALAALAVVLIAIKGSRK